MRNLRNSFEKVKNVFKNTHCVTLAKNFFRNIFLVSIDRLPKIKWIVYEVTDTCNSRCKHCEIWKQKPSPDMLKPEELERILKDDFFKRLDTVLLTGGEPVLRRDIKEIISAIYRVRPKVRMTLSTNGLLPDRALDVFRYTLENDICMGLGISLDAIGEKHDLIRGVKGNFEKVDYLLREAIKLRQEYKNRRDDISIGIGFTLSNLTVENLAEVMDYAQQLDVKFLIQLYEEFPFYRNVERDNDATIENYSSSNNRRLIEEIEKLPLAFHHEILLYALRGKLRYRCDSIRTFFVLRANGDLSPCLAYSHTRIGNLKQQSPHEVLNNDAAKVAKKIARNCRGCSNGWATDWSYQEWPPYFWKLILTLYVKKFLYKFRKRR